MRFKRHQRFSYEDTPRKRAALQRKYRAEVEAFPLFADAIAEGQPAADDVMAARAERWVQQQKDERARRAAGWRKARLKLAGYSPEVRKRLHAYWQRCGWPGDPSYLSSMMHMYDTGRLDLSTPAWRATA